ncbi:hypothetical protein [Olivibacter sitiensis]|uniref:hypothetical protein n=1 Tax=Olivibacter sitiensis TaxID=376470 RepID=UPI0003F5CFBF|nr:hypothetical protein [Olivibacter sitiensis]
MMAHADSTLILTEDGPWPLNRYAFIVSKTGDMVSCYTYYVQIVNFPAADTSVPRDIYRTMFAEIASKYLFREDLNPYFNHFPASQDSTRYLWRQLAAQHPWALRDDGQDGAGCPPFPETENKGGSWITDGPTFRLQLITKGSIRNLEFYLPAFFEEQCPGREGRKRFMAINDLLLDFFGREFPKLRR